MKYGLDRVQNTLIAFFDKYGAIDRAEQNAKTPYSAKTGLQGTRVAQRGQKRCTGLIWVF